MIRASPSGPDFGSKADIALGQRYVRLRVRSRHRLDWSRDSSETPLEGPVHPSQQPPNAEGNYSSRIWLCFDGVAEPLVERCGSV